eukprot:893090_1
MSHEYRPSLSTGIFGAYQINEVSTQSNTAIHQPLIDVSTQRNRLCDDTKEEPSTERKQQSEQTPLESFFSERDDPDIPIKAIYDATKKMDEKYQLVFKSQCNYKGCCKKPEIDPNLINGDMYICKAHRMTMAAELKKELGNNRCNCLEPIISKLERYSDVELYKEGKQMESNDYFLRSYSSMQQQKLQISKQLLTMNPSSAQYWDLVIKYKKFQQYSSLLLKVRKISNPFLAILAVVVVALAVTAVVVCVICLLAHCFCSGSSSGSSASQIKKKREEERKKREKAIKDAEDALGALDTKFFKNEKLKKECQRIYDGKREAVENYETALKQIEGKINTATTTIDSIAEEIRQNEAQLRSGSLPIDKILGLQAKIEDNKANKEKAEQEKRKHELDLQKRREAEEYQKMKQEAEMAKYKLKLKQEEEDRINFDRAKTQAEIWARNTSSGRVAVYVVYDSRLYFSAWCKSAYGGYQSESYGTYGNWKICKMEANSIKKHYTTSSNKFCFRTKGKYTFWTHYNDGFDKYTSGDEVEVVVR